MFVIRRFDAVLEPTHDAVAAAKKKFEATGKAISPWAWSQCSC